MRKKDVQLFMSNTEAAKTLDIDKSTFGKFPDKIPQKYRGKLKRKIKYLMGRLQNAMERINGAP